MARQIADPYRQLAAAIILQAVQDVKIEKYRCEYGETAICFLQSEFFECLADLIGLDPRVVREELNIKCVS